MADRLEQLEKLLEAEPDDAFCLYGLAQEHAKRGNTEQAIAYYDRTLLVDPAYCYAYYHKARAQEDAGRIDDAVATLRAGLAQAKAVGDVKAAGEISAFLDTLT